MNDTLERKKEPLKVSREGVTVLASFLINLYISKVEFGTQNFPLLIYLHYSNRTVAVHINKFKSDLQKLNVFC